METGVFSNMMGDMYEAAKRGNSEIANNVVELFKLAKRPNGEVGPPGAEINQVVPFVVSGTSDEMVGPGSDLGDEILVAGPGTEDEVAAPGSDGEVPVIGPGADGEISVNKRANGKKVEPSDVDKREELFLLSLGGCGGAQKRDIACFRPR